MRKNKWKSGQTETPNFSKRFFLILSDLPIVPFLHIYIYIERERGGERETETETELCKRR